MELLERSLPSNLDAERAILGAVMLDNSLIDEAAALLSVGEFYSHQNRRVFDQMLQLAALKLPIDLLSICEGLKAAGTFEQSGGISYVASLIDGIPRLENLEYYAQVVRQKAGLRSIISGFTEIVSEAFDCPDDGELIERAQKVVFDVANRVNGQDDAQELGVVASEALDHAEKVISGEVPRGLSTGLRDLDYMLSGLEAGQQIVIAARPSMGKTALGLSIALAVAREGTPVGLFELEMSARQIGNRALSIIAGVPIRKLRMPDYLLPLEWTYLANALRLFYTIPLVIDDRSGLTVADIRARARRMVTRQKVKLLVIDYLGLIRSRSERENRNNQVGAISRELKDLAKELNIPIILMSQLSRANEGRGDKRPQLSDLRDSGEIEQNADVVIFIHREEYYNKESPGNQGVAELLVRKQRDGETGDIRVSFAAEFTRFADLAREY